MTDTAPSGHAHADRVRNHWWWRPGWHHGRRFYTWHLTFENQPRLHALVDAYQPQLADLPNLDPVPREWLHLTMQGVGFADEIDQDQIQELVQAAKRRLAALPAPELMFHRALLRPEAVVLPAAPAESVTAIRDAIRNLFPDAGLGEAPEARDGFLPHVTVAYVNADGPAEPVTSRIADPPADPATAAIARASLIVLDRDNRMYQWRELAAAPLGPPASLIA